MGNFFLGRERGRGGGGERERERERENLIQGRSPNALLEEMGQAHFNE